MYQLQPSHCNYFYQKNESPISQTEHIGSVGCIGPTGCIGQTGCIGPTGNIGPIGNILPSWYHKPIQNNYNIDNEKINQIVNTVVDQIIDTNTLTNIDTNISTNIDTNTSTNIDTNNEIEKIDTIDTSVEPTDKPEEQCVVCLENKKSYLFAPCGHVCCCALCHSDLTSCPVCRANISSRIRAFF
jgi:hypothetical protein